MFKLTHNDDCKHRLMSHTVGICSDDYDIYTIEGYGSTRKEAFSEFMIKFNNFMDQMKEFEKTLYENPEMIEVDCSGHPMENNVYEATD